MTIPSLVSDQVSSFYGDEAGGTSETLVHNSGTGSGRVVWAKCVYEHNTDTDVSGVTYNGVAMLLAKKQVNANSASNREDVSLWYLANPASGSNDVVVSFTGTTGTPIGIYASTWTDGDTSTVIGNVNGDSGGRAATGDQTYSFTTGTANSVVISMCAQDTANAGTITASTGSSVVIGGNVPNNESSNSGFTGTVNSRDAASAGALDIGFNAPTGLNRDYVIASVEFLEAAGGPTPVSSDSNLQWSLLNAVQSDIDLRASILNAVQSDSAVQWAILQAVQSDSDIQWSMLQAIESDSDIRWSLLNSLFSDSDIQWSLLNSVQADSALQWSILQAIQSDSTLLWDLLSAVQSDVTAQWSIINSVASDADIRWQLVNSVLSDSDLRWSVLNSVLADSDIRWSLLEKIFSDSDIRWDVDSSLLTASSDLDIRWSLLASIFQSMTVEWNVLNSVTQDTDFRWQILNAVAADFESRWDILQALQSDADIQWSVISSTESDVTLQWSIQSVTSFPDLEGEITVQSKTPKHTLLSNTPQITIQ